LAALSIYHLYPAPSRRITHVVKNTDIVCNFPNEGEENLQTRVAESGFLTMACRKIP
jgi:hypothetical protein